MPWSHEWQNHRLVQKNLPDFPHCLAKWRLAGVLLDDDTSRGRVPETFRTLGTARDVLDLFARSQNEIARLRVCFDQVLSSDQVMHFENVIKSAAAADAQRLVPLNLCMFLN